MNRQLVISAAEPAVTVEHVEGREPRTELVRDGGREAGLIEYVSLAWRHGGRAYGWRPVRSGWGAARLETQLGAAQAVIRAREGERRGDTVSASFTAAGGSGVLHVTDEAIPEGRSFSVTVTARCGARLRPQNYFTDLDDYRRAYNQRGA